MGDITITVARLQQFQAKVLQPMVNDLAGNEHVRELSYVLDEKTRSLLAGSETFQPAKVLMDRYESATGTAPTLHAQFQSLRTSLETLNRNITSVVKIAESGEDENIKLSTELSAYQLSVVLGGKPATGGS
ncbi:MULTISPECIES: hypothetical protein [unclassified Crossiella]|uniref:hypothetical protein n=1 Tax=unclassified Crossiella TaxID=2620835 RepID=UPI001FFFC872|nr:MULTISPECIES: hypothetical protein [unclassified Crossiella]MCK2239946.1 hypothetical protein [Crossiella sp. S99.2]MCK2252654.1 hypothetical protein [Crossiella sp. S99.1]